MNFRKKILPITLTLLLSVGSLGTTYAAAPENYQQKMTSWMKNDPNPMPMNMNSSTNQNYNMMSNLTPEQMLELDKAWMEKKPLKQKAPAGQKNYQQKITSWMKNDPNPMPMNMNSSTNQNYNMMSNLTPE
ncbi:CRISPR/Cas system-associated endonuclease/helicase Cas3, partial [Desulfohalotomaculum tongense]|uniref:hypothetical protein n=1 Tax=Desulforadius tongensis TaxID=1216062 RepID=UPI00195B9E59